MSGPQDQQASDENAPIVPVQFASGAVGDDEHTHLRARKFRRVLVVAAAVVLFFAALSVIFVLPRYVSDGPADVVPSPLAEPDIAAETPAITTSSIDAAVAAELRRKNQAQLEELLDLVESLERRNIRVWSKNEFEAARGRIGDGEKAYREQRYKDADNAYGEALASLKSLDERTARVVAEAVDEGFLAIASRDAAAATKAFRFALAISPAHERAQQGLARAATLDQVIALINEAAGYEELNDTDAALTRYREALDLDAEAPGASSAIARIEAAKRDTRFSQAMSEGLDAVTNEKFSRAKTAFEKALKIKPGSGEAADALEQVENRLLADRIAAHLRRAAAAEQDERWSEAASQYRQAHKLDSELDGAAASAARADRRAKLDAQLESVLAQPQRLGDDGVHREALAILAAARRAQTVGPRLAGQLTQLEQTIKQARTPIAITLLSDNATEVTLYKVGKLGRFTQRSVSVIPGRYVVVGKRDGFRDVRVEFEVSAARADAMITVRCEQKLAFGS